MSDLARSHTNGRRSFHLQEKGDVRMKMHLVAVPPGGGEADFQLELDSEYVPRVGE
jgi:hypothetical protein